MDWDEKIRLANAGDIDAQYELGSAYSQDDKGLDMNISEAEKWFLLAAKQGCSAAQYHLVSIYFDENKVEAKKWFDKAKENGHAMPSSFEKEFG